MTAAADRERIAEIQRRDISGVYHADARADVRFLVAALGELEAERDRLADNLTTLKNAWNAHFETCVMPLPFGVTFEDLERWRNAPSDTAGGAV